MKRLFPIAVLALLALCSCGKDRQCKCVTTDVEDDGILKIVVVDHQMKCDDITEMGFERKEVDQETNTQTLVRYEMHTVSCRDYPD